MIITASSDALELAAAKLKAGELVAFPTETVYGLGADAYSDSAIQNIYRLKGRPANNPLIVHIADGSLVSSAATLQDSSQIRSRFEALSALWPGPLSIILPKNPRISALATAGLPTVAVRVPDHAVALELLRIAKIPVAAPSANASTSISPTTALHVEESFGSRAPLVIDGGPCRVGLESTVVSVVESRVQILRPGGVSKEALEAVLHEPVLQRGLLRNGIAAPETASATRATMVAPAVSPGLMSLHYAPRTPLVFLNDLPESRWPPAVGLLAFGPVSHPREDKRFKTITVLSPTGSLDEAAARLFAALRELDKQGLDMIVVDTGQVDFPVDGIGHAILDRLLRARHS